VGVFYGIYLFAAEETALAQLYHPPEQMLICVAQALFCPFTRKSGADADKSICAGIILSRLKQFSRLLYPAPKDIFLRGAILSRAHHAHHLSRALRARRRICSAAFQG